jgi:peptidyl-tRNA hydrolase, PTH1 family
MAAVPLKLIVGLGNPGSQYSRTRHNAGFWLIDELVRRYGGSLRNESRFEGDLGRTTIEGVEVRFLKPMSFMNHSGGPTQRVAAFYKIPVESVLVAYDELDFPAGVVRLKQGGGAGGHNGMRDMIAQNGDAFWRLRIGIGHPGDKSQVLNYVLGRPQAEDERLILEAVQAAADVVPRLLTEGYEKATNWLHTLTRAAPSPKGAV